MVNALKVQALINWLISGAPPQSNYDETIAELARRLFDAGVEADILVFYQMPKNPLVGGHRRICMPGQAIQVREFTHEEMETHYYKGSVVDRARMESKPIRYVIGNNPEFDAHAGSKSIIDAGYSEFSVIPLIAVNEVNAAFAVGVKREGGLDDDQFEVCRRIAAPLSRVVESRVRYESAESLLATFLGRDAGARVNAGMVRRGDAEMIRAVILFTDIEGFTERSNRLPITETVTMLTWTQVQVQYWTNVEIYDVAFASF